ncbi:MAG: YceD family protein [Anaerolineae bacterium]
MRYNVAQLLKEGIGASRVRDIDGDLYEIDENNPGPTHVEGAVEFLRTVEGILASCQAHLTLLQTCRRCLELVESDVHLLFEEEFVPSIDMDTGATLPITDDTSAELLIDEHHILDLSEVLRQNAILAAAGSDLCRADCRGLCPVCGRNLNDGPCGCVVDRTDPRLAVLGKLLGADQPENDQTS